MKNNNCNTIESLLAMKLTDKQIKQTIVILSIICMAVLGCTKDADTVSSGTTTTTKPK